ncbi:MAG: cell division protein FtsI (penicillin-binding protein 3) [Cyclobacteriaceae bacterium]|jgi:cell division protein FtsI (penicillin-binding protein 3)
MSVKASILLRVRIAFLVVFVFAAGIIYRVVTVQYVEGDQWRALGQSIGLKVMDVNATRGNIYADNGALLATSLPFYQVAFDPYLPSDGLYKSNIDSLSYLLSQHFGGLSQWQYKKKMDDARKNKRRYLILSRQEIGYQDKKLIEEWPIFREGRLRGGIIFEKVEKRFLPFSHLGLRTIGSVNADNRGTVGLEYSFNRQLAGTNGKAIYQKMSGGGWRPIYDGTEVRPVDGLDIETTIDINIQDITETALLQALSKHKADYGVAVVMEVATGEIKAMSNLSRNSNGRYYERYNYAVGSQGSREPGSTFKLASMIALLEESNMKLSDTVDTGDGSYHFFNEVMKDHKPGGYGVLTLQEVFEKSSNIGVAKLINAQFGHEPEKFISYLNSIGLSQPLGFQMIGEGKPYIKTPSDSSWSGTTLPWMSHGYELKMTPLQTLSLYNAVANDGKMIQPMIVKSIKKADKTVENYKTKVLNKRICSDATLQKLHVMLEGVVERGTAQNISNTKYKVAGKTGTAKKVKNGRYTSNYYTSFVGYFPAEAPRYSCIVVIDEPKGYQIYGSDVSAPVFKDIADKIYAMEIELHDEEIIQMAGQEGIFPVIRSGHQEELTYLLNQLGISNHSKAQDYPWVKTSVSGNAVFWNKNPVEDQKVPDVRGMTLRDALYVLENAGLEVATDGRGRVKKQSIYPGTKVLDKQKIKLDLG